MYVYIMIFNIQQYDEPYESKNNQDFITQKDDDSHDLSDREERLSQINMDCYASTPADPPVSSKQNYEIYPMYNSNNNKNMVGLNLSINTNVHH